MKLTCTNCGKALMSQGDIFAFQKVICCADCHKIVTNAYDKAARLVSAVLDLYRESLRVSLVKKQAHLPTLPKDGMPMGELQAAMNMVGVLHANGAKEQQTRKD
jgi:hypothetical protein